MHAAHPNVKVPRLTCRVRHGYSCGKAIVAAPPSLLPFASAPRPKIAPLVDALSRRLPQGQGVERRVRPEFGQRPDLWNDLFVRGQIFELGARMPVESQSAQQPQWSPSSLDGFVLDRVLLHDANTKVLVVVGRWIICLLLPC